MAHSNNEQANSFADVLRAELAYIAERRRAVDGQDFKPSLKEPADEHSLQADALQQDLCGLTISGGGIRSATFGLGILQGFAAENFLKRFDYLSTVSGGGYIGSWLSAWTRRTNIDEVSKSLCPAWFKNRVPLDRAGGFEEAGEVQHLRRYSNYLAPRASLLSTDGWTLIAIFVRNLMLNQMVFLLGAASLFLVLRAIVEAFTICHAFPPVATFDADDNVKSIAMQPAILILVCAILIIATVGATTYFAVDTHQDAPSKDKWRAIFRFLVTTGVTAVCLSLVFVMAEAKAWFVEWFPYALGAIVALVAVSHCILGVFIGGSCEYARREGNSRVLCGLQGAILGLIAGGLCGVGLTLVLRVMHGCPHTVAAMAVAAPPLFLVAFVIGNFLQIGLLGIKINAYERERWSGLNARLMTMAAAWLIVMGVAVFGPWAIIRLTDPDLVGKTTARFIPWLLGGSWIGSTWAALTAGQSSNTGGGKSTYREYIAAIGPAVFLIGLLTMLAFVFTWAVYDVYGLFHNNRSEYGFIATRFGYLKYLQNVQLIPGSMVYNIRLLQQPFVVLLLAAGGCLGLTVLLGWQIGVNTFSLHELYALRLIRCYLGAVRFNKRKPSIVTAYDQADDLALAELHCKVSTSETNGETASSTPTDGPYHILCAALNRQNVGRKGKENGHPNDSEASRAAEILAFQDRKAESFVFTPKFCGSQSTGYCATKNFAGNVTLGTAMAVSGAAASPNSGYHSSPAVTALLTVFNARLGAWFGNPNNPKTRTVANPPGWQFLYRELLGDVNAEDKYVYVSDGGHFENMGVYELIRRRCRYIVCVDTWADPEMRRENLGRLVRNVRIDFGVRIEIDVEQTRTKDGRCGSHIAVGKILYGDVHPAQDKKANGSANETRPVFNDPRLHLNANEGVLVYIKMGLTGDEPNDLLNYQMENPRFPHDPISDQFFDESQFESYRALGLHTARILLQGDTQRPKAYSAIGDEERNDVLFSRIYQRWLPPPPHMLDSYTHYNEVYADLLTKLRDDEHLHLFAEELYGESSAHRRVIATMRRHHHQILAERLITGEMAALLENVWFGVELEKNILHPVHDGWLNVFKKWTSSTSFWRHWLRVQDEFSPDTRRVMKRMRSGYYDSCLEQLYEKFATIEDLLILCARLKWTKGRLSEELRKKRGSPITEAEKAAVQTVYAMIEEAWLDLECEHDQADPLRIYWLDRVHDWKARSFRFHTCWEELRQKYSTKLMQAVSPEGCKDSDADFSD